MLYNGLRQRARPMGVMLGAYRVAAECYFRATLRAFIAIAITHKSMGGNINKAAAHISNVSAQNLMPICAVAIVLYFRFPFLI